jgi:hypothetical protein
MAGHAALWRESCIDSDAIVSGALSAAASFYFVIVRATSHVRESRFSGCIGILVSGAVHLGQNFSTFRMMYGSTTFYLWATAIRSCVSIASTSLPSSQMAGNMPASTAAQSCITIWALGAPQKREPAGNRCSAHRMNLRGPDQVTRVRLTPEERRERGRLRSAARMASARESPQSGRGWPSAYRAALLGTGGARKPATRLRWRKRRPQERRLLAWQIAELRASLDKIAVAHAAMAAELSALPLVIS